MTESKRENLRLTITGIIEEAGLDPETLMAWQAIKEPTFDDVVYYCGEAGVEPVTVLELSAFSDDEIAAFMSGK